MTGEMCYINQDGEDSNGEVWELHAEIAKALGGVLKPFDVYQGPYIVIEEDVRIGNTPYAIPLTGLGIIRLWICGDEEDEGFFKIYKEDTDTTSFSFLWDDVEMAIEAAKSLMGEGE